eukprot:347723-Chlamydomonas_euryale.AAC.4
MARATGEVMAAVTGGRTPDGAGGRRGSHGGSWVGGGLGLSCGSFSGMNARWRIRPVRRSWRQLGSRRCGDEVWK